MIDKGDIIEYFSVYMCTPIYQASFFLLFPFVFYLIGYLGYSRAGKIAVIGLSLIGLLDALSVRFSSYSLFEYLLWIVSFAIFLNMSFHAALRDIFGLDQDDIMVIEAIFGTDKQESSEFFIQYKYYIFKHIIIFLFSFGLYCELVLSCDRTNSLITISNTALSVWILVSLLAHLYKSIRISNPFIYFPYFYAKWQRELQEIKRVNEMMANSVDDTKLSSMKYSKGSDKNTVVWVIGESSTKHNWSLYGYERETTPMMDSLRDELLVFDDVYAAAPTTVPAFEMMMTPATISKPHLWQKEPNVILIAKQAGYHVYWISNHTTDAYGLLSLFAQNADETYMTNRGKARGEGSFDSSVLPRYKDALNDNYDKKLIIMHLLDSHPAYNYRYPSKYNIYSNIFDDTVAKELFGNGRNRRAIAVRNSYDNSVRYSDMIRHKLLELLQNSKESEHSTWLYHPDHGEDVCHNTNFSGHNKKAKEQWEVPMILWSSSALKDQKIVKMPYRLDSINHTILGLMKIEGEYYNPEDDLMSKDFISSGINGFDGMGSA